jgi:hypothetical protein
MQNAASRVENLGAKIVRRTGFYMPVAAGSFSQTRL